MTTSNPWIQKIAFGISLVLGIVMLVVAAVAMPYGFYLWWELNSFTNADAAFASIVKFQIIMLLFAGIQGLGLGPTLLFRANEIRKTFT